MPNTRPFQPIRSLFLLGGPLPSGNVAQGGPGGWSASYTKVAWIDQLMNRGQAGITDGLGNQLEEISDFSLWGGTITFDNDSTVWHTQPEADVPEGQFDFYTAALHELAHALGFGTSDSWLQQVVAGKLVGRYSSMGYGADAVPLHAAGEGALLSLDRWFQCRPCGHVLAADHHGALSFAW